MSATVKVTIPPPPAPEKIWMLSDVPFIGYKDIDTEGYNLSNSDSVIVIDNGSYNVRAGWSFDQLPRLTFPPLLARYRERKFNRSYAFVGNDIYADGTARGQAKNAYEPGSNIISNWDVMEGVLDYIFLKMGINGNESGGIGRGVLITEPVGNFDYTHSTMSEILFECYGAPRVAYGVDSLFSYRYNKGRSGLVISSSYSSTNLIPVLNGKAMLGQASRLNWGRFHCADYLLKLMKLKYSSFPGKISEIHANDLVTEHCYVSHDYLSELERFLDWQGLEKRDRVIQHPYVEQVVIEKSEEELARAAERRRESGRRLQEQAAKARMEKLLQKEEKLRYYKNIANHIEGLSKRESLKVLEEEDLRDAGELMSRIKELERGIKKGGGGEDEGEEVIPSFPLLDIADEELDEEEVKQKRQQRLNKLNWEARVRAKAEKKREEERLAEEERIDREKRENNLEEWLEGRRTARMEILEKIRQKEKMKAEVGNRKSAFHQKRMKTIANLAWDIPNKKRRRRKGGEGDDDTFGADDSDWSVYRQVQGSMEQSDEDEEEDLAASLRKVEMELLEYDPNFTEDNLGGGGEEDWRECIMNKFLRGGWPNVSLGIKEKHQLHINIERIRVGEVLFQPNIVGLDQAGIIEIAERILRDYIESDEKDKNAIVEDIYLCGGYSEMKGFKERIEKELREVLPCEIKMNVRKGEDGVLDSWKGASEWARCEESKRTFVSRAEYNEFGSDYRKEYDYDG